MNRLQSPAALAIDVDQAVDCESADQHPAFSFTVPVSLLVDHDRVLLQSFQGRAHCGAQFAGGVQSPALI